MKSQNCESSQRQPSSIISSVMALLLLTLCAVSAEAQEAGEYVVPVRTKRYARLANPLLRNTEPVEVTVINGEVYLQGDISLGRETFLDGIQNQMAGFAMVGDAWVTARWENGIVPYVILSGFTNAEKQVIIDAMNHIAERTHVCFRPRSNQPNYIKFKKYTVDELGFSGGQSKLGRCGPPNPDCADGQEIKLSRVSARVVRHEIGHALGAHHEQTREDRDQFVEILWDNIEPEHVGNFRQVPLVSTDVGNYDFTSIMHYHSTAFGKKVGGVRLQTIRRRSNPSNTDFGTATGLSSGDTAGINGMYPNEQGCTTFTTGTLAPGELAVGQSKTTNISANKVHDLTGIFMRANQRFYFSVTSPEWNNGSRETTAAGYDGSLFDQCRRYTDLKMMSLVGEIFEQNNASSFTGTHLGIGMSRTWTATRTGYLVAFANDCLPFYGDNSRMVTLTVKRIQ